MIFTSLFATNCIFRKIVLTNFYLHILLWFISVILDEPICIYFICIVWHYYFCVILLINMVKIVLFQIALLFQAQLYSVFLFFL